MPDERKPCHVTIRVAADGGIVTQCDRCTHGEKCVSQAEPGNPRTADRVRESFEAFTLLCGLSGCPYREG